MISRRGEQVVKPTINIKQNYISYVGESNYYGEDFFKKKYQEFAHANIKFCYEIFRVCK